MTLRVHPICIAFEGLMMWMVFLIDAEVLSGLSQKFLPSNFSQITPLVVLQPGNGVLVQLMSH
jgi:hypothetical protein